LRSIAPSNSFWCFKKRIPIPTGKEENTDPHFSFSSPVPTGLLPPGQCFLGKAAQPCPVKAPPQRGYSEPQRGERNIPFKEKQQAFPLSTPHKTLTYSEQKTKIPAVSLGKEQRENFFSPALGKDLEDHEKGFHYKTRIFF